MSFHHPVFWNHIKTQSEKNTQHNTKIIIKQNQKINLIQNLINDLNEILFL